MQGACDGCARNVQEHHLNSINYLTTLCKVWVDEEKMKNLYSASVSHLLQPY